MAYVSTSTDRHRAAMVYAKPHPGLGCPNIPELNFKNNPRVSSEKL